MSPMPSYADFIRDPMRVAPTVVAHRGAWTHAPENSVAALEAAVAAGSEIMEVDVRRANDGVLHILHDPDCGRVAGHPMAIEEMNSREIAQLRLYASDGRIAAATDEHIPTLAALLEAARDRIFLDLDVKHDPVLAQTAALARQMGCADQVDIKVKVNDAAGLDTLRALRDAHGLLVMPKTRFEQPDWQEKCNLVEATGGPMVETKFDTLETLAQVSARLATAGIAVWVNTLTPVAHGDFTDARATQDPDAVWGRLHEAGVSIFQTDLPEALSLWRSAEVRRA